MKNIELNSSIIGLLYRFPKYVLFIAVSIFVFWSALTSLEKANARIQENKAEQAEYRLTSAELEDKKIICILVMVGSYLIASLTVLAIIGTLYNSRDHGALLVDKGRVVGIIDNSHSLPRFLNVFQQKVDRVISVEISMPLISRLLGYGHITIKMATFLNGDVYTFSRYFMGIKSPGEVCEEIISYSGEHEGLDVRVTTAKPA